MKYSAVLFDLDGTLTDSAPGILGSMQYSLAQFGIAATAQELRRYLGPPLREMFASYLQKEQIEAGVEIYHADYEKNGIFNATLYEGIRETLCALDAAGVKVCLATAKPQQYAQRILEHFGIDSYFELIGGVREAQGIHTKTDVIAAALSALSLRANATVMVGDRRDDLEGAANCGIAAIGAGYGYAFEGELEAFHPVFLAKTPWALLDFFCDNSINLGDND